MRTLAETIDTTFHRIQFTPDLLPADVIGTQVYDQSTGQFSVKRGPIFANIILADEINRAPAKVQAALLEAMQEKQVTIGGTTFKLDEPFLVLATQNPIEQEGTYPLPEAQVDRFMLKLRVGYPSRDEEKEIMRRMASGEPIDGRSRRVSRTAILEARHRITELYMDDRIMDYIVDIVHATREPAAAGLEDLAPLIEFGASPRATIALAQASRAHAFLRGRAFVTPDDVKAIAPDVLRHRVLTTYEAEAEEVTSDQIVQRVLAKIESSVMRVSAAAQRPERSNEWLGSSFGDARNRGVHRRSTHRRARSRKLVERKPPAAVPPEILRQVKLLELRTRGLVNSLFTGEYRSAFKGQGMEFAEVREYQPGDEVRSIDWNVTARMRRPYVKRYIEERELTVMLAVDVSGSERFGTRRRFKSEVASELAAVLAMSAIRNNDRVGGLMFTDRVEHVVPPRKGRRHALRLIRDMLAFEPEGRGTDIGGATEYLNKMLSHKAIIFLVSDFLGANIERPLKLLAQRHDVVAVTLEDPSERLAARHRARATRRSGNGRDARRRHERPAVREQFVQSVNSEADKRRHLLRRLAIDEIAVSTDAGIMEPLLRFFRTRERRIRTNERSLAGGLFVSRSRSSARSSPLARRAADPGQSGRHGFAGHQRIGDPFRITVGMRAPRGATIEFPRATDSASAVQSLDPVVGSHERGHDGGRAIRGLSCRGVGRRNAGRQASRRDRPVQRRRATHSADGTAVFVQSVLPADSAQRVPKPARPLFELNPFPVVVDRAADRRGDRAGLAHLVVVPPASQSRRSR